MRYLYIVILIAIPSIGHAEPKCSRIDFTKTMSKEQRTLDELIGSGKWKKDVFICDLGFYKIMVPAIQNESKEVFIFKDMGPLLLVEDGVGAVLYGDDGKPVYSKP